MASLSRCRVISWSLILMRAVGSLGRRSLGAVLDPVVGDDRDGGEDGDHDDHDQELNDREAAAPKRGGFGGAGTVFETGAGCPSRHTALDYER